jgi:hypothetical protein
MSTESKISVAAPEGCAPLHGSGCLSKLSHAGSPSAPGCIGTDDPARWQHLLWFDGQVWATELFSDHLRHVPTYDELRGHFDRWKDSGESPWMRVCLPNDPIQHPRERQ